MILKRLLVVALVLGATPLHAIPLTAVEPMPTLPATALVPASALRGPLYSVDAEVPVVGYMGQFTLRASAGTFRADGVEMLGIRIGELAALSRLGQLSQTGVFADALATSALKTGAAIGQAVTNPVATVEGIPAGVGRFFQSAATALSRAAESSASPGASERESTADSAMDLLGMNKAKRRIAKQVGADPYTTNPVLAKQLDDLARAAFAGGVTLDVALATATAGVATALSATATVSNLVWEKSPEDIRSLHEQRLAAMSVGPDAVRAFVTNRWFPPTLSVPFVEHVARMPAGKGRAELVTLAGSVASESEARYMVNAAGMVRAMGTERDPVAAVGLDSRIVVVRTRSGRLEVAAPVDVVVWTDRVKAFAERNTKAASRTVHVTGIATERARDGLRAAGWSLREATPR